MGIQPTEERRRTAGLQQGRLGRSVMPTRSLQDPSVDRLLGIYLNDHLAGSTAGLRLARRLASGHRAAPIGPQLASLCQEIDADRATFITLLGKLGIRRRRYKIAAGWLAELLARAKGNGRIFQRSPLSSVIELEMLRLGVEGKRLGWRTLRTIAEHDPELDLNTADLDALTQRAAQQAARLEELRTVAICEALSRTPPSAAATWPRRAVRRG